MAKTQQSGGIGFLGLLTIVFIVLKLTKQIDWSWWFVLAPIWAPIVLLLIGMIIYFLIMLAKNGWRKSK